MLLLGPCSDIFSEFNLSNIPDRYARHAIHVVSARCCAKVECVLERKVRTSSLSSNRRVSTFPLESHLTSEWNRSDSWVAPISWHRMAKSLVLRGRDLMRLTIFTVVWRTSSSSGSSVFAAKASLWIRQWVNLMCGATLRTFELWVLYFSPS